MNRTETESQFTKLVSTLTTKTEQLAVDDGAGVAVFRCPWHIGHTATLVVTGSRSGAAFECLDCGEHGTLNDIVTWIEDGRTPSEVRRFVVKSVSDHSV